MHAINTLAQWLEWASAQLPQSDSPQLDAELLLCSVLKKNRAFLRTWPETTLNDAQLTELALLLKRRQQGEPIAYIIGEQEFWSLKLKVSPAVLIPRPETELIIDTALALFSPEKNYHIADLGTGSGAIALALAHEFPHSHVVAGDFSAAALEVAEQNRQILNLNNCELRLGSWFDIFNTDELFDLIVANPPYIAEGDPNLEHNVLNYEPKIALTSGATGLNDLRYIIENAVHFLKSSGWLILEHGWRQADTMRDMLRANGYRNIQSHRDLAGHQRVSAGQI